MRIIGTTWRTGITSKSLGNPLWDRIFTIYGYLNCSLSFGDSLSIEYSIEDQYFLHSD